MTSDDPEDDFLHGEGAEDVLATLAKFRDMVPKPALWVRADAETAGWAERLPGRLKLLDKELLALSDEEPMLLPELDGFIAGLLIGREVVPPAEWLPQVWRGNGGPGFERTRQAEKLARLIMQHHDAVAAALDQGGVSYTPIFDLDPRNDDILWEGWIEGFYRAWQLQPDYWQQQVDDDEQTTGGVQGLMGLLLLSRGKNPFDNEEVGEEVKAGAPELIPFCVEILYRGKAARGLPPTPAAPLPQFGKVGRNDPCPCGSGSKYKKCCGRD